VGGHAAQCGHGAWPRQAGGIPTAARAGGAALFEQGSTGGRCRVGPGWQHEGEGEEEKGHRARGPAREKEGSGPSPDEQEGF
jgi:hypothetical protein